ncbi:MAG TPA: alpha/beta fold hydrolase [Myxococcaceae bacterium]|nr:alpha/beta fold hydrolase [Myxococcaceae bacterium]
MAIALFLALSGAWMSSILIYYRIRGPRPRLLRARCADGWELAVYHRPAPVRRYEEPVVLCHGLAANHYNFDFEPPYSMAHLFSQAGFDCFTVEWRGTRASSRAPWGKWFFRYCVDDYIQLDGPALVRLALETTGARSAFWIGHSMGGAVGYAYAQGPHRDGLRGLVTLGSPIFFKSHSRSLRALVRIGVGLAWPFLLRSRWLSIWLAPFLGYLSLPLSDVMSNPHHIPPRVQRQLFAQMSSSIGRMLLVQFRDWLVNDAFRSFDRREDWQAQMGKVQVPVLIAGGNQDRLAPAPCIEAAYQAVGSKDKTLVIFGKDRGDAHEYGHGDLIFGSTAPQTVYPLLQSWLEARATARSGGASPAAVGT